MFPNDPVVNGQAKAFNKIMIKLLRKLVKQNKRDWHENLDKFYRPIALLCRPL